MQAALDIPLTVYGTGGQTRAFIHVTDTARCIEAAVNNPPAAGDRVEIFNQVAETCRVRDLANMIAEKTGVDINFVNNPRNEAAENELEVVNQKFKMLGVEPKTLDAGLFDEVISVTQKYKDRCDPELVIPKSYWNKNRAADCSAKESLGLKSQQEKEEAAAK
mmetsp:Transcript_58062/g.84950  ORF Transcript_58062/g.84950 Transcript_58062/m.84950 type:complete len:163 (-) Transcript_58062:52-540(-)